MSFIKATIKVVASSVQLIIEKQEDILFEFLTIDEWEIRSVHIPEINFKDNLLYLKGDNTKKYSNICVMESKEKAIELAYTVQSLLTKLNEEYEYAPDSHKFTRMDQKAFDL